MNKRKPLPSQELLRERYDYDEEIGHLIHKPPRRGGDHNPGEIVGGIKNDGRRRVKLNRKCYFEYNLIWMWYYGEDIPSHLEIDHIDNDRDNNRIENLRLLTHEENMNNLKIHNDENYVYSAEYYFKRNLPLPDDVREEKNKRQRDELNDGDNREKNRLYQRERLRMIREGTWKPKGR